jgi:uncharacterized protein YndB with AHSA1/START domain
MTESAMTTRTCHVFIKATPGAIWDAITATRWNQQAGYQSAADYDPSVSGQAFPPGGSDVVIVGDLLEAEPPRKLVQTWRTMPLRRCAPAKVTRLTWEIEATLAGVTVLTLTRERDGVPQVAGRVPDTSAGWCRLLTDVKTTLETAERQAAVQGLGSPASDQHGLPPPDLHADGVRRPRRSD